MAKKRAPPKSTKNTPQTEARKEALKRIIEEAQKVLGKESVSTLRGEHSQGKATKGVLPTGSIGLDHILGGGLPKGRIIEIYGPSGGGKTTLTLHIAAEAQKQGSFAAFIDAEHALTPEYAQDVGVNLNELLFSQPNSGESAFELMEYYLTKPEIGVIIVDSVAALVPRSELSADIDNNQPGQQARLMSKGLRRLTPLMGGSDTILLFINQVRVPIGGYAKEVTSGGKALLFYASVRMDIRRIGSIKKGDKIIGNRVKSKTVKNKVAPPFQQVEFDLIFGKGISTIGELIDYGIAAGTISKAGAWFSYERGEELVRMQGREALIKSLEAEDKKLITEMKKAAKGYLNES